jgi:hypothetical protein
MEIKLTKDGEHIPIRANYLVYIPKNFDISKFVHLIPENFIEHTLGNTNENLHLNDRLVTTKEEYIESFIKSFHYLLLEEIIDSYNYYHYSVLSIVLKELDLVLLEDFTTNNGQPEEETTSIMINISGSIIKNKIDIIKMGGWGLKHGGWGHESED